MFTFVPIVIALVLFLLYFSCEDAPWHRSNLVESRCLTSTVIMLSAGLLSFRYIDATMYSTRELAVYDVTHLMLVMVSVQIIYKNLKVQPREPFYNHRRLFKRTTPPPPLAARIADELERNIGKLLRTPSSLWPLWFTDNLLLPAMFGFLVLQQLGFVMRDAQAQAMSYFIQLLHIVFIASWISHEVTRWRRHSPLLEHIHEIIEAITEQRQREVLHHVLATLSVGTLFGVAWCDTQLVLTNRALELGLLDTTSKAILINGLQQKGIRQSRRSQLAACSIVLRTIGDELTEVKNLLDSGGNYHNLYKLVYEDITFNWIRAQLVHHLQVQGLALRDRRGRAVGRKIISDIDDTLYCSGGTFPAGCDRRLPKHVVYPGCFTLLRELDSGWRPDVPSSNVVLLSARPHVYKDLSERRSYQTFLGLHAKGRIHCIPTLLPGSLATGFWAMATCAYIRLRAWRRVGELKATTFFKFRDLYMEYDFIFCGDNGQGDLLAAQHMLSQTALDRDDFQSEHEDGDVMGERDIADEQSDSNVSNSSTGSSSANEATQQSQCSSRQELLIPIRSAAPKLAAVLIHEVLTGQGCLALEPAQMQKRAWRRKLRHQRIFLHRTHVSAAVGIHKEGLGLLSAAQVRAVAVSAVEEFDTCRYAFPDWGDRLGRMETALREDLAEADKIVKAAGLQCLPQLQSNDMYHLSLNQMNTPKSVLEALDKPNEERETVCSL